MVRTEQWGGEPAGGIQAQPGGTGAAAGVRTVAAFE